MRFDIQAIRHVHFGPQPASVSPWIEADDTALEDFRLTAADQQTSNQLVSSFGDANMSGVSASELAQEETLKTSVTRSDPESQLNAPFILYEPLPIIKNKSLGAGVCQNPSFRAKI